MKKIICILLCIFLVGVTSSAKEAAEDDYVNIKNAVLNYVAAGEYQKAVECIDLYGYTVQENPHFYADLQNDRQAILYVIRQTQYIETKQMVLTLVSNKKYALCLTYLSEQIPLYADCPDYQKDLQQDVQAVSKVYYAAEGDGAIAYANALQQSGKWAELFAYLSEKIPFFDNTFGTEYKVKLTEIQKSAEQMLARAKFSGSFAGENISLTAQTDDTGAVITELKVIKNGIEITLADETGRGFIYTEPDAALRAAGAYFDSLQNSGYVFCYLDGGALKVEITADGYGGENAAGTYVLQRVEK